MRWIGWWRNKCTGKYNKATAEALGLSSAVVILFLKKDTSDNSIDSVDKIELMTYNGNNDTADSVYKDNFDVGLINVVM